MKKRRKGNFTITIFSFCCICFQIQMIFFEEFLEKRPRKRRRGMKNFLHGERSDFITNSNSCHDIWEELLIDWKQPGERSASLAHPQALWKDQKIQTKNDEKEKQINKMILKLENIIIERQNYQRNGK